MLALALSLLLAGIVVAVVVHDSPPRDDACRADGKDPVTTGTPVVSVLGDSYSAGALLPDPKLAWSTLLGRLQGWTTYVEAVSSTGVTTAGFCQKKDFLTRLPQALDHGPEILVVQTGLNDVRSAPGTARTAMTEVLRRSAGIRRVVVVGPPPAPVVVPAQLRRVDAELQAACQPPACSYISARAWQLPYLADRLHLTPTGHLQFAVRVSNALDALDGPRRV